MDILSDIAKPGRKPGQFEGRFLVSMPDMKADIQTDMFAQSVVYICAHGIEGAIGFIVNHVSTMTLLELVSRAKIPAEDAVQIDNDIAFTSVRQGGPVDGNRGFVLHGPDYKTSTTVSVGCGLLLTSNIKVLRDIATGIGPQRHAVMLGYAGWGKGQLEGEMADNTWLVIDADQGLVLDDDHDAKYDAALANIGINSANFIGEAGRA